MICSRILASGIAALLLVAGNAYAAEKSFVVSDDDLARLGVRLGSAETVELVEIAAAPAHVVVPPARQALVSAPASGVVARLFVAEGDAVTAGQLVAEIDSVAYLDQQRDFLDAAAAAALAASQESRDRGLYAEGIIAQRRVAEAVAAAAAARAHVEQARAQLALAGYSAADLERLAARRELETRLELRAPLTGIVTRVFREIGGRVDALDAVLGVADLRELWLEVRLPQESAAHAAPGMPVSVEPPGQTPVVGAIATVGGIVAADTQTVLVRATVENASGALRAGQFLTAHVFARASGGVALAVPTAAVSRHGNEALLFVRRGANVDVQRVDVLADDGTRIYVAVDTAAAEGPVAVDGLSALKALWLASDEAGG